MPAATLSRADEKSARHSDVKPPQKILYQTYFKSVGTRTYAAQVKEAGTGNHFLLLTEGRRDKDTDELRKTSIIIFSEDFEQFFDLVDQARQFVRAHPVPADVLEKQTKFWANKSKGARPAAERKQ